MKEEEIIQAANEYVGHAEEAEEDLSTYCNRKAFEAGAKWMQEKMIKKACESFCENCRQDNCELTECLDLYGFKEKLLKKL